jgi:hypothetical protein
MGNATPEFPAPDEPPRIPPFSMLHATQDEIDVRFGYIMDDLHLNNIERGFDPKPPAAVRLTRIGNFLLKSLPHFRIEGW